MIFTPESPGANKAKVYDTVTGECLSMVAEIDTETGRALVYTRNEKGGLVLTPVAHPNPCRLELAS